MTIYNVHRTRLDQPIINIDEQEINQSTDITLFGRKKLQYGAQLNENLLHLLEHFACPENSESPGTPDLTAASADQVSDVKFLSNPITGQLWYNSTQEHLYFYNGDLFRWEPVGLQDDIASNWGIIYNGQQIPKPVSATTGYVFDYSECSWIVSPYQFPGVLDYLLCNSNSNAQVTSIYSVDGDDTIYEGFATYLIVGIKDNVNLGSVIANPTPTPTPSVTPSAPSLTDPATPTPTTTPTPTPTPTPAYIGDLKAIVYNASSYNDAFNGDVDAWFPGDYKEISNPAVTNNRYQLLFTPTAPHNPWVSSGGNYYLYTSYTKEASMANFPYTTDTENQYIFVSNDGINGLFYRVINMTLLGGMVRMQLDVSGDLFSTYYNRIPKQTSNVPQLQFSNYQYVYQVSVSSLSTTINQAPFLFICPTPYQQNFTLEITGGKPPYTITDITYSDGAIPISATASGINQETFTGSPVSFSDINTIAAKYTGAVSTSNPNISLIPNGYKVNNFLTADIFYPANYDSVYGVGVGCRPETFWYYDESAPCEDYSGYGTNLHESTALIEITDDLGSVVTVPLTAKWATQTVDKKRSNTNIGLTAIIDGIEPDTIASASGSAGIPAGEAFPMAGVYVYTIDLQLNNDVSAVYPTVNLANLKYLFSMLRSPNDTDKGNWLHDEATNLAVLNTGLCYIENDALIHVGDDTTFIGGSPLIPYDGSSGSIQEIEIIQYVDVNGIQRMIPGSPIIVKLFPSSVPNSWTWRKMKTDGTNNNLTQASDLVPFDLQLEVWLPGGLPAAGSLIIPIAITCTEYSAGTNCFSTGTGGGQFNVEINFTNL